MSIDQQVTQAATPDPVQEPASRRRTPRWAVVGAAVVVLAGVVVGGYMVWPGPTSPPAAAATCPATDSGTAGNPASGDLAAALVPGHPATATVCRYYGLDPAHTMGTLARQATVPASQVGQLAAALNAGQRPRSGTALCPADDLTAVRLVFGYAGGRAVTVRAVLTGCQDASNGQAGRILSPDALGQLAALVG